MLRNLGITLLILAVISGVVYWSRRVREEEVAFEDQEALEDFDPLTSIHKPTAKDAPEAAPPKPQPGIEEMILDLPDGVNPKANVPEDKKEAVDEYHKNIAELMAKYERVKSALKKGDSIFKYRGLLAKGRVDYREGAEVYALELGVNDAFAEERDLWGYDILFNNKGVIVDIRERRYRR